MTPGPLDSAGEQPRRPRPSWEVEGRHQTRRPRARVEVMARTTLSGILVPLSVHVVQARNVFITVMLNF